MSLRYEQYWALLKAKNLLVDLLHPSSTPKTKKELRDRIYKALRHFPALTENGQPIFSTDPFTKDDIPLNEPIDVLQTIKYYASKNIFIEVLADGYKFGDSTASWRGYLYWKKDGIWVEEDCGSFHEWEDAFKSVIELAEQIK
jgi:hypothetical protein